jgi:hypothetical protein
MPGQNQQVLTGLQEAAKTQMRAQMPALTGQPMGVRQVQQAGAQATAMQAQPMLQVQEQAQKQAAQLGQMALKEEAGEAQKRLQERQLNQSKQQRLMESELDRLGGGLKQRLLDDQFQFQKDELGRTFFNDRQLLDYKLATAKSNLELRDFEQKMRQASQRKLQMLKTAQAKVTAELTQGFQKGQQELNQEQTKRLAEAKRALEEKIQREQARARNRASMFSAGSTLLGIGIAALNPAATATTLMLGGMAGGAGGNILAGTTKI